LSLLLPLDGRKHKRKQTSRVSERHVCTQRSIRANIPRPPSPPPKCLPSRTIRCSHGAAAGWYAGLNPPPFPPPTTSRRRRRASGAPRRNDARRRTPGASIHKIIEVRSNARRAPRRGAARPGSPETTTTSERLNPSAAARINWVRTPSSGALGREIRQRRTPLRRVQGEGAPRQPYWRPSCASTEGCHNRVQFTVSNLNSSLRSFGGGHEAERASENIPPPSDT
jgi:hypothetical protein